MYFQTFRIILEAKTDHGVQYVLSAYCFTLFQLALFRCLRRDETDELGHALLYTLFGVFRYLRSWRHGRFHNARNIRYLCKNAESALGLKMKDSWSDGLVESDPARGILQPHGP